ncbi:MAG: hypothetical protein P9L99_01640 [Candidatus Lernaella stagnicola]|nr:hypothetical protein [Candidatus Lernaella stagnicola]
MPACQNAVMLYLLHHLLLTAAFTAPVLLVAARLAAWAVPEDDAPLRLLAALLIAFGFVTGVGGILGIVGLLGVPGYLVLLWGGAAAAWFGPQPPTATRVASPSWSRSGVALAGLVLAAAAVHAGYLGAKLAQPAVEYDALTYHLHFPAQWLAAGRVFLIDTPFGDAAPGYAPATGELWYAWLMAPWRGAVDNVFAFKLSGVDALAKVGQFPFLILALAALAAMGRRLVGKHSAAYLPAAMFALVPWVIRQASSPAVDLMMSSLLLTALAFAVEHAHRSDRRFALFAGASLGLAAGVKFLALSYAPLVAAPLLVTFVRRREKRLFAWWLGAAAVTAAPWYVRNWIVTGNPLFPLHVSLGSLSLFSGAFTREAMLASPFHVPSFIDALPVIGQAFGFWFVPVALIGVVGGLIAAWREPRWRMVGWIAPVALVWHFLIVPYSSQDRFLLWIVALTLLPWAWLGAKARESRVASYVTGVVIAATVVMVLVGGEFFDSRYLRSVLAWRGWPLALLVLATMALVFYLMRRRVFRGLAVAFAVGSLLAVIAAQPTGGVFVKTDINALRHLPLRGYQRIWETRPECVAYAGRNRPYYLAGRGGLTRVRYLNLDGGDKLLHDYVGESAAAGDLDRTREKAPWRRANPNPEAWLENLRKQGVEYLFVETLSPSERRFLRAESAGFPVEFTWATGDFATDFSPVITTKDFALFRLTRFE